MNKSKKNDGGDFVRAVQTRINSRRKGRAITLTDMSEAAGYSSAAVRNMASGIRRVPARTVALWRKRWKLHISREEMMELMEKHLIEEGGEE